MALPDIEGTEIKQTYETPTEATQAIADILHFAVVLEGLNYEPAGQKNEVMGNFVKTLFSRVILSAIRDGGSFEEAIRIAATGAKNS